MTRRLRIITGLILFVYVTGHLVNLSLGLVSIELMDAWRETFQTPWDNPVGGTLLLGSLIVHAVLGLSALYYRNTLKMTSSDAIQFISGLLIVPMLTSHLIGIKLGAILLAQYEPTYGGTIYYFWIQSPLEGLRQIFVLVLVWIHGAIGVLTFFRLQKWWPKYGGYINPLIVLVPLVAMLGFAEAGKQIIDANPNYVEAGLSPELQDVLNTLSAVKWWIVSIYALILLLVLAGRIVRLHNNNDYAHIQYAGCPPISTLTGASLLEIAVAHHIPHASLCRGRGRCGTCRVRILASDGTLDDPTELEQATLDKFGAGPNERLACQVKPVSGTLSVERMLPPYIEPRDYRRYHRNLSGKIKEPEPVAPVLATGEGA